MIKKACGIVLAACLALTCAAPALAKETAPVFSTIVYLTNEEAAPKLASYAGITGQAALEKLEASARAAEQAGAIDGRVKPAYVYAHVDLGDGYLMELGALATAARMAGEKLVFTDVVASYSRPVNRMLRWTPMGPVSAAVEKGGAEVRVCAKGMATVAAEDETSAKALAGAGFTAVLSEGRMVYQKAVDLAVLLPILEEAPIGQGDIYEAYAAMFDYYRSQTGTDWKLYPRMALDLRTPVGLNEAAKASLLAHLAQGGFSRVSEMDMETYYAAMSEDYTKNVLADCYVFIDKVQAEGQTIRFKIGAYLGTDLDILEHCALIKGPDGWKADPSGQERKMS